MLKAPPTPFDWAWPLVVGTEIALSILWPFPFDYEPIPELDRVRVPTHDEKMRAAARTEAWR